MRVCQQISEHLGSLRAGSPRAEMRACNNHGGNPISRGREFLLLEIVIIYKMPNKLKSMQKSNKFKASLSSFEEIRMLDVKLN